MKRHFLLLTAALGIGFAACSSDDDDNQTETSTNANQPSGSAGAGGSASTATAGSGGGASTSTAGSAGSGVMAEGGSAGSAGSAGMPSGNAGPDPEMSFFVTSEGSGEAGGNLGGLEGADAICERLAAAVGAGDKTWRAYLSTDTVNASERIGEGPWFNHGGELIANDLDELHADDTVFNGNPNLILDENGVAAPGPEHDILTGSDEDGNALPGLNCDNWTSSDETLTENPRVGHSDIPGNPMFSPRWNSAHVSANCSQAGLAARGGAGRLYCFAE